MGTTDPDRQRMRSLLCDLQSVIRDRILAARNTRGISGFSRVAAQSSADTIYAVDKISEAAIEHWFSAHWPSEWPVQLVMEGIDDDTPLVFPVGTPADQVRWICILDPVDGTRNLMYDKRSAWILAGIAAKLAGRPARLDDLEVAAMTEIPTTRSCLSDQLSAVRGNGLLATTSNLLSGEVTTFQPQPATATDCRHAFATVIRFFPDALEWLANVEEQLWNRLYPEARGSSPLVFNDHYITTGGQLYEILIGRDRFIADLRPLAFQQLGIPSSLACHPYDMAALMVAEEAGVIVEDPLSGEPLSSPLDTTTPVAWCAYANAQLAASIRPVLRDILLAKLAETAQSPIRSDH